MRALACLLAFVPGVALAGDPCPIPLEFSEYTPEWRDRDADLKALASARTWLGFRYRGETEARVSAVAPSSPAEAAGLRVGDVDVRDRHANP